MQRIHGGGTRPEPHAIPPRHYGWDRGAPYPLYYGQDPRAPHPLYYGRRTEQTCCHRVSRCAHFHNIRHSTEPAEPKTNAFLTVPAIKDNVGALTRTVQELLAHKDLRTTTIITNVLSRGGRGIKNPRGDLLRRCDGVSYTESVYPPCPSVTGGLSVWNSTA